jgi:hypothetical protein
MSLVVAHCSKRTLKIVSDTRLSDPISRLPCSHFDGALKILLLSSELGFAFAGDPAPALEVLSESQDATAHRADLQSLTALLLEKTRQSRGASDFLAFSTAPSPRLRKISAGGVSEEQADYWIGDQEAFNCYQEYFHSAMAAYPERLQHNPDYLQNQMDVAMKEVIESSRVQSVGDFLVPASSEKDGLRYVSYARITVFPTAERSPDGWFKMKAGGPAEGGYTISMLTPYDRGIPAVAFHFLEGRFGVLFCPGKLQRPAIIKEVDTDSFSRQVSQVYGIRLQGQIHLK